jgi:transposase
MARAAWQDWQPTCDSARLVFLDETSAATDMTRRHGRSPVGERCHAHVPGGHWKTTTFVGALRPNGMTAPFVLDGPMDGDAFGVYVREGLPPTLVAGAIVVMDNLPSHTVDGVRDLVEATGATLHDLPPYAPDLNPIEQACSKFKALLRKTAARSIEALWNAIGRIVNTFSAEECKNYFAHSGSVLN